MAREKSELKSGMGKAVRAFTALIEAVEDLGGSDEHVRRLETDAKIRQAIAQLLVGPIGDVYPVTIDNTQTLEQMVANGRYDWKDGSINAKNFPLIGTGRVEVRTELLHFNRAISTKDALKEIDDRGYRPATIAELLAFGAGEQTKELQRQFPIIALGSVWQYLRGLRRCPCLYGYGSERRLYLDWFDGDWNVLCPFLVVRK